MPILIIVLLLLIVFVGGINLFGGTDMTTATNVWNQWYDLASNWADVRGNLSAEEVLAIIANESSGNPNSSNPSDPSYGLMGVEVPIGKVYAPVNTYQDLYNPNVNIEAGSGFLSYLKNKYSSSYPLDGQNGWVQMYNVGETKFLKGIRNPTYERNFATNLNNMLSISNQTFSQTDNSQG